MIKSVGVAALSVLCAGTALAKPVVTEFDVPGAAGTYVSAINANGDIAGILIHDNGSADGYVRRGDGSFVYYDQAQSFPTAINPIGETAGYTLDADSDAFIGDPDGGVTAFSPKGTTKQFGAFAAAIDARGNAAGYFTDMSFIVHGFLRNHRGRIVAFDAPGGGGASHQGTFVSGLTPTGIAAGSIVDAQNVFHGFLRAKDGGFTGVDIDGAGTGNYQGTRVMCVSTKGTVGGYYKTADNAQHGFVRDSAGNVATFDGPGAVQTVVESVDGKGTAAGVYIDGNGVGHGFSRDAKGHLTTIDAPDAGTANGQGTFAMAIGDSGEIAGYYFDAAGKQHGFFRSK
jgi:hypothetical protein